MNNPSSHNLVDERLIWLKKEVKHLKQVHEKLMESKRMLSTLMNNLPGIVYRCTNDKNWTIEFISHGTYDLLGFGLEKLKGDPLFSFVDSVHLEDRQKNLTMIKDALKKKTSYELVYPIKTTIGGVHGKNDKVKWVMDRGEGVFTAGGELIALEGFITDISDQKIKEIKLKKENILLRSKMKERYKSGNIIGKSPSMQRVYDLIFRAASRNANVSIYGESGTGKELVARAIHDSGDRRDKAFIPVNCGAIPETLMESEFFGHKKGGFSGAYSDKKGVLDLADSGTLFLDELGEISLNVQIKLLRVLDGQGYRPVGGSRIKTPDTRIICATNQDIKNLITQGKMREDFFYRIHVIPIYLPPLRERKEDIPLLADHFLEKLSPDKNYYSMPPRLRIAFENYTWPGNVRELHNLLERFVVLGETDFIDELDKTGPDQLIPAPETLLDTNQTNFKKAAEQFEKKFLLHILEKCRWRKGKSAMLMGITPRTLQRKLKHHNIR